MTTSVWKLALLLASLPTLALAEHATRADPADPASPVPAAQYESAFTGYQSFQDEKSTPWKEVNAAVTDMSETVSHTGHGATTAAKAFPITPTTVVAAADTAAPSKPAAAPAPIKPATETPKPATPATGVITASGVVQQVDKANAKVKLSHDPIPALGWPKMTMFLRLKDGALADQVKEGDTVQFQLEKSGSGYVISNFAKPTPAPAPATGK